MGIYIKGLKVPDKCFNCKFSQILDLKLYCKYTRMCVDPNSVPEYCDISEVSKPHGRLIDVDNLIPVLASWITSEEDFKCVLDAVEQIPSVIESEE